MSVAGGISVHAVDIAAGRPAAGLAVRLLRHDATAFATIAEGRCTDAGTLEHPCNAGEGIVAGRYRVEFEVAAFYRAMGQRLPDTPFLETVRYDFGVDDASQHYHLPFKFTPWGYSLFRGGQ